MCSCLGNIRQGNRKSSNQIIGSVEPFEGESIEQKVAKLIENNEPITDGAPIIYTEKKDGVLPQYDIRTDKWEISQSAMNAFLLYIQKQFLQVLQLVF